MKEATQPVQDATIGQIVEGAIKPESGLGANFDEDQFEFNPVERRRRVFSFIASETRANINAQMKQLVAKMNQLERKHYENKVAELDRLIAF